jgi:hypothetical protein
LILRVTPTGQGSVFYQSGQTHVRSLAIDQKQNVIAGTEPSGYIIAVNPTGQGFVILLVSAAICRCRIRGRPAESPLERDHRTCFIDRLGQGLPFFLAGYCNRGWRLEL